MLLLAISVSAKENYINVPAGLLSQESQSLLESKAENIYNSYDFSAYFILNEDKEAYETAKNFYTSSVKGEGVVFVINKASGDCYAYSESIDKSVLDSFVTAYRTADEGTYAQRIEGFLNEASSYAKKLSEGSADIDESERLMPRFMDYADVIENERESAMYTDIDAFSERKKSDVVFVIYRGEEKPVAYAEEYYKESNFGFGKDKTGVILAVCADSSDASFLSFGKVRNGFSESDINKMISKYSSMAEDGKYIDIFVDYLDWLNEYMIFESVNNESDDINYENDENYFPPLEGGIGENGELMPRIYDGANIIGKETEAELTPLLDEVSTQTGIDFAVMTVYEVPDEFGAKEYAERYFAHFDFGHGEEKNGVLLMISVEPENCFLTAFGEAAKYFGSGDLKKYTESFYTQYKRDNYDETVKIFAAESAKRLLMEKLELPIIAVCLLTAAAVIVSVSIIISKRKKNAAFYTDNENETIKNTSV